MELLNTIPDSLYDISRKCIFKVGDVVLILRIFEQVADTWIHHFPCGDVASGNAGVSGARISVRCHTRNP